MNTFLPQSVWEPGDARIIFKGIFFQILLISLLFRLILKITVGVIKIPKVLG